MTLAKKTLHSVSWSATGTIFKGVMQLIQMVVLARYLSTTELGMVALLNLAIGFFQLFSDAGLSNAIIYYKNLTKQQLTTLFFINLSLGGSLSVILLLLAKPISLFFDVESLTTWLMWLAPIFFIRSCSQQSQALLQQALKFDHIAKVEILAQVLAFVGLIVGLLLYSPLFGVVIAQLINAVVLTIGLIVYQPVTILGQPLAKLREVKEAVSYGLYQTGESLINYLSSQFDQLIIGKLLGAETLGIYSYVKALVFRPALQLINPIVNRVTFPLLSAYKEQHSIKLMYRQIINWLAHINTILYLGVALFAEQVLLICYGENWLEQALLLRFLAIYMLLISLVNPVGGLLRATGQVKRGFWWNIAVTLVRPLVIYFSISHGVIALVQALIIFQLIFMLLHVVVLVTPCSQLSFYEYFAEVIKCILKVSMVILLLLITAQFIDVQNIIGMVLYSIAASFLCMPLVQQIKKAVRTS